jgi:shikimate dehydrogenase
VQRYRFAQIAPATQVFGVIGWPIEHSLSPLVHNAGFEATKFDGVYLPLPVPPEWEHFKATVGALLDHTGVHFRGASVTMPHKQHLIRFVKERGGMVDEFASRVGAANTLIVNEDGSLDCVNTDGPAIVSALAQGMQLQPSELAKKNIAILGTGGTARSAALALSDAGANAVIISREKSRAEALAKELHSHTSGGKVVAGDRAKVNCDCFDTIINCTPVGMADGPAPDESPLPDNVELKPSTVVMDLIYAPPETPLIVAAKKAGSTTISGMAVFIQQAAMQFKRWTGHDIAQTAIETVVVSLPAVRGT